MCDFPLPGLLMHKRKTVNVRNMRSQNDKRLRGRRSLANCRGKGQTRRVEVYVVEQRQLATGPF